MSDPLPSGDLLTLSRFAEQLAVSVSTARRALDAALAGRAELLEVSGQIRGQPFRATRREARLGEPWGFTLVEAEPAAGGVPAQRTADAHEPRPAEVALSLPGLQAVDPVPLPRDPDALTRADAFVEGVAAALNRYRREIEELRRKLAVAEEARWKAESLAQDERWQRLGEAERARRGAEIVVRDEREERLRLEGALREYRERLPALLAEAYPEAARTEVEGAPIVRRAR